MSVSLPSVRTWPKNNSLAEVMPASVKPTKRSAAEPRRMTPPCVAIGTFIVPLPQIHDGERLAHLAEHITTIAPVSQSELAKSIIAPALHGSVVQHGARVIGTGTDFNGLAPKIDGGKPVAHFVGLVAASPYISEAKLAVVVLAPALHAAIIEYCTAVVVAGSDAHRFTPGP